MLGGGAVDGGGAVGEGAFFAGLEPGAGERAAEFVGGDGSVVGGVADEPGFAGGYLHQPVKAAQGLLGE